MNTKLIVFYEISDFCRFIDNFEGELIITMNDACHNGELVATWDRNHLSQQRKNNLWDIKH